LPERDPEVLALTHGEPVDAGVLPHHAPRRVDDRPRAYSVASALRHEAIVASGRHEAQFLALALVRSRQAEPFGVRPHLGLFQLAEWKQQALEPCWLEHVQKVALVLAPVQSSVELRARPTR